jgi:hypothetical protein
MIVPFVYYRSLYYIHRVYFKESKIRIKSKLQIHHLHYGAVFLLIVAFIFIGKNNYSMALFGFGLILDEFVPSLLMPGNRKVELQVYGKGFIPTLIIFLLIFFILLLLYLLL